MLSRELSGSSTYFARALCTGARDGASLAESCLANCVTCRFVVGLAGNAQPIHDNRRFQSLSEHE